MAKKIIWLYQAAGARRRCDPVAADRSGSRSARSEHHGILQGLQCGHAGDGKEGTPIPTIITAYADKSFSFEMKLPPVTYFIKQALKIQSGSKKPGHESGGKLTEAQVREIAEKKMKDLNADTVEAAMAQIAGSARSMGIQVEG